MKTEDNAQPDTRQARRTARRRAEILDAAARVFAEKGFHHTTTRDIAEEADIAEGTIYNYFESKGDLLIQLIEEFAELEKRRQAYTQLLDADVRQSFHDMLVRRFAVVKDRDTLLAAVLPEIIVSPELRDLYQRRVVLPAMRDLEDHIQARVERGQIEAVDVPLAARVLAALGMGLEIMTLIGDTQLQALWGDLERLAALITRTTFDGVLPAVDPPARRGE